MQDIINSLLNFCYNDTDSIEFQLFLITVKCLVSYEDSIGCGFVKDRYKLEGESKPLTFIYLIEGEFLTNLLRKTRVLHR